MSSWTDQDLKRIGEAEELRLTPMRRDGVLGSAVTIWVVPYGEALYVRSVRGPNSGWFRGTQERHEGRIQAGGLTHDVTFVEAGHDIDDEIDAAYRAKYHRYSDDIVGSTLTPAARSTTLKLEPRSRT
jgi:hypothetical protein